MTSGSLIQAMIRAVPPQCSQFSTSMLNTRLRRCAQVIAACCSAKVRWSAFVAGRFRPLPRPAGGAVDNAQHFTHHSRPRCEQKPQRVGKAQHPLPDSSLRKYLVHQQHRGLCHNANINIRTSPERKAVIDRAARLLGRNRSEFVLEAAEERAREVLMDQTQLPRDDRQFQNFTDLLDQPLPAECPNRYRLLCWCGSRLSVLKRNKAAIP